MYPQVKDNALIREVMNSIRNHRKILLANEDGPKIIDTPEKIKALMSADMFELLKEGNLGRSLTVDTTKGNLDLSGDLVSIEGPDEFATVISCSISMDGSGVNNRSLFARISFGTAGFQTGLEMDICQGITFTVPASFLKVSVANDLTNVGVAQQFTVGAFVSLYPQPQVNPNTRTQRTVVAIPPAGAFTSLVPVFATKVKVYRTPTNICTLDMLDNAGAVLYTVNVAAATDAPDIFLANEVRAIRITNNDGAVNINAVRFIYSLSIN